MAYKENNILFFIQHQVCINLSTRDFVFRIFHSFYKRTYDYCVSARTPARYKIELTIRMHAWTLRLQAPTVKQTTVCFTVRVCKGKVAFQPPNYVKQLVNQSMYQNRVDQTSFDAVT